MDIDVVGVLFWYFSLAFGVRNFIEFFVQKMNQQILERLDDKKTMWDVEVRKILDFTIQQILERRLKLKKVSRRPALRCGERKGEWNLRKEERKKPWWLRDEYVEACIHSFFSFKFSCEKSWNRWFNSFNKYLNHSLTGANNRRRDLRAHTMKKQECACDLVLSFFSSFLLKGRLWR